MLFARFVIISCLTLGQLCYSAADPSNACGKDARDIAPEFPVAAIREEVKHLADALTAVENAVRTGQITPAEFSETLVILSARNEKLLQHLFRLGTRLMGEKNPSEAQVEFAEILHDLRGFLSGTTAITSERMTITKERVAEVLPAARAGLVQGDSMLQRIVEGRPVRVNNEEVTVRDLFTQIKLLTSTFPSTIKVEWEAAPELPWIEGDGLALQRVLLNLVNNANKHAFRGKNTGTIRLRAELISGSSINTTGNVVSKPVSTSDGQVEPKAPFYLSITVSDDGVGMTEKTLQEVFSTGFSTAKGEGGQGLGLSSALTIAEDHGGFMAASSQLGEGSQFRMFIPVNAEPTPTFADRFVLTVDDNRTFGRLYGAAFGKDSHHHVHSGNAAVYAAKANPGKIKLILIDNQMPGLSMPETVKILRQLNPTVPIVIATGDDQITTVEGADKVLHKPVDMRVLKELVRE